MNTRALALADLMLTGMDKVEQSYPAHELPHFDRLVASSPIGTMLIAVTGSVEAAHRAVMEAAESPHPHPQQKLFATLGMEDVHTVMIIDRLVAEHASGKDVRTIARHLQLQG